MTRRSYTHPTHHGVGRKGRSGLPCPGALAQLYPFVDVALGWSMAIAAAMPWRASLSSKPPFFVMRANSARVTCETSSGMLSGAEAIQKEVSKSKEAVAAASGRRASITDSAWRLVVM